MSALLELLTPGLIAALLLHVLRAGAFVSAVPMFGMQRDSRMLRLVLAVGLGGIFFWTEPAPVTVDGGSVVALVLMGLREILIGLAAGMGVRLMTVVLSAAGEIISHEMGFAMARAIDPSTGLNSTVVAQLLQIIGLLLVFQLDIHHHVLELLHHLYEWSPVGAVPDTGAIFHGLKDLVGLALEFAVQYSLPVLAVMVLLTATLVVLARAVQNINLLEFSFGLRILMALAASSWFLSEGGPFLENCFYALLDRTAEIFAG